MDKRINRGIVFFVVVICFISVALFIVINYPQTAPDTTRYVKEATNLLTNNTFALQKYKPTVRDAPGYGVSLYLLNKIGINFENARVINIFYHLGTAICIYWGIISYLNNSILAFITFILILFNPFLLGTDLFILSEMLYTFLVCMSFTILLKADNSKNLLFFCFAGILSALASLTRGVFLLFPFFISVFLVILKKNNRRYFLYITLYLIFYLMPVGLWCWRNYVIFKEFIPVSVGGGATLWIGAFPPWDGTYNYKDLSEKQKREEGLDLVTADKKLGREAIEIIKRSPFGYLRLCVKKIFRFWFAIPGGREKLKSYPYIHLFLKIFNIISFFLFSIGIYYIVGEYKTKAVIFLLPILYTMGIHTILFAIGRFRVPIIPFQMVFVGYTVYRFFKTLKNKFCWEK